MTPQAKYWLKKNSSSLSGLEPVRVTDHEDKPLLDPPGDFEVYMSRLERELYMFLSEKGRGDQASENRANTTPPALEK